jgi:hypothetical protein
MPSIEVPLAAKRAALRPQQHLISRAEMARKLGLSRPAITKACREGGRLANACAGSSINMLHPDAQRWLLERAPELALPEIREHQADAATPARATPRRPPPARAPEPEPGLDEPPAPAPRAARRRPAPPPPPVELPPIAVDDDEPEPPRPIDELERELGTRGFTNLAELAEPLTVLTERYGNAKEFEGWIRGRKALEEARKAQMLRERIEGRLIARTTVVRMVDHIDTAFRLLLSDAPRAIATRIAPQDVAATAALIRDVMSQHLVACRTKMDDSLAADDPMAPLAEAAE